MSPSPLGREAAVHPYSADAVARSQREDRERAAQQAWLAVEARGAARWHHGQRRAPFPRLRHTVGARLVEVGVRLAAPGAAWH